MSIHSERVGAPVHLGKQAPKPLRDAVPFKDAKRYFVAAGGQLPPLPAHFGHGGDFRGGPISRGGWGMLGNGPCDDGSVPEAWAAFGGAGDCAWAGPVHEEMEAAKAAGRPVPRFTARSTLEQYGAYSGYNLQTGENDNGSAIADVIAWRQRNGLRDADGNVYKIGPAFELTPGDIQECWECAYLLENVGIGIVVTQAQIQQFDAGARWDYVAGSPQEGGHYIPVVGRASADDSGVITWAHRVGITRAFYKHQNDEAVGYLDLLRYNKLTGQTAEHFKQVDVERFFQILAQKHHG